ncbi:MAG: hypothetical protein HYZ54_07905 [Ignavibacteriae bacterium]|nr:hypothetical protein [Ignavibacteriota bacterium]
MKKINKYFLLIVILPTIFTFISCGGGLRAVELMYAGKNTTMYFITPFTIEGENGKVEMDITYRDYANKDSSKTASCKFTFYSDEQGIEKVSQAYFITDSDTTKIYLKQLDRFFVERDNNKARYEGKLQYSDIKKIFTAFQCTFTVVIPKKELVYGPDGTITKTRIAVRREMLDLIEE